MRVVFNYSYPYRGQQKVHHYSAYPEFSESNRAELLKTIEQVTRNPGCEVTITCE